MTTVVKLRVRVGYTTLGALAACAGVSLDQIEDATVHSSGSSVSSAASNRLGLDSNRTTTVFTASMSAAIPWHGKDPSILAAMCRAASHALPVSLVRPLEEVEAILRDTRVNSVDGTGGGVEDRPVPVYRWVSTRTMRDMGGKFLVCIWRPMLQDQAELQRVLGV